jgi:NAD(P)-dependent dehydrogenase (short-subunit alcohol dehydrogenase family)
MSFSGKVILITGNSSGIGLATTKAFLRHKADKIVGCGRSLEKWDLAKTELVNEFGREVLDKVEFVQTDIRIESQVRDLIDYIYQKYHTLDICINNAGVNIKPVSLWEEELVETHINRKGDITYKLHEGQEDPLFTNFYGTMFCLKWEIKRILERGEHKKINIVNVVSAYVGQGVEQYATYAASKSGLASLTKSVAGQVATEKANNDRGPRIYINSVNPGNILTPLLLSNLSSDLSPEQQLLTLKENVPLDRIGRADEVSRAILFLSDPKNTSYIFASAITVDGGLSEVSNFIGSVPSHA